MTENVTERDSTWKPPGSRVVSAPDTLGDSTTQPELRRVSLPSSATAKGSYLGDRPWRAIQNKAVRWTAAAGFSAVVETSTPTLRFPEHLPNASSETLPHAEILLALNITAATEDFAAATFALRKTFAEARQLLAAGIEAADDLHDRFTVRLELLLRRFGQPAFDITGRIVLLEGTDAKLGLSALRAAGHVKDTSIHETRLTLARNALRSKIPELRYGALHVLADLGDHAAAADVAEAARREPISALRADMKRLADLLGCS